MRWFRFAVLIVVATILQTSFLGKAWVVSPDIRPDLLLILLVFFAVHCESNDAVITSFVIGFAADLANPAAGLMGPRIISFGLFGTLLSNLHHVISLRRLPQQGVAIFVVGLLTSILSYLLAYIRPGPVVISMAREFFWQPALSAFIGPFLSLPMAWLMGMNAKSRRRGRRQSLR
jgi:rod shape-determining protein MreD